MHLKSPFVTSNGAYEERETILIELHDELGNVGWGECVAFSTPWYTEETVEGAWHILTQFLIPSIVGKDIEHPSLTPSLFQHVRRHHMAKAGLEMAIWDCFCKRNDTPLYQFIGGVRQQLKVGVAIGLQQHIEQYEEIISKYLEDGYERFKIKIKRGNDIELVAAIRERFPHIPLMVDANSDYTLADTKHLQKLDRYQLMMIEQPLDCDDIIDHATLQASIQTPICLDESIVTYEDARKAIQLGSCKIMNVKLGRVGGMTEALRIHQLCKAHNIAIWCGGMLESGIGRAHNMALASMEQFTIPGDISASSRYWHKDIIVPEVEIKQGLVELTNEAGIGFGVDEAHINQLIRQRESFHL